MFSILYITLQLDQISLLGLTIKTDDVYLRRLIYVGFSFREPQDLAFMSQ